MKSGPFHHTLARYGFLLLAGAALFSAGGIGSCNGNGPSSTSVDTGEGKLPPAPAGLQVAYDTLSGTVRVSWSPVKVGDLDGYVVYRVESASSEPVRVNANLVRDTFFVDTVFLNLLDPRNLQVSYRLKAQDENANLSLEFSKSVSVSAPSPTKVRTLFAFSFRNAKGDSASPGDVVTLTAQYSNATRNQSAISWTVGGEAKPRRTAAISGRSGSDSLKVAWPDTGTRLLIVTAEDAAGSTWKDSVSIQVVADRPHAAISGAASVRVGEPAELAAGAAQDFGGIVQYKWDNGKAPGWDDSSSDVAHAEFVYQIRGSYPVRLFVKDDDGYTDSAVFTLSVINDNPVIGKPLQDTTVSVHDSVTLSITATDPEGIRDYRWDINGDGEYDLTTVFSTTKFAAPATGQDLRVSVSVRDRFDGETRDAALVHVVLDEPDALLGKDTTVSINDAILVHGKVQDGRGTIVALEWSIGSNDGIAASKADTVILAPSLANPAYRVILRAVDDDGNVARDTMIVHVVQDAPMAILSGPAQGKVHETLLFHNAAAQDFGSVSMYKWDDGKSPGWDDSGAALTSKSIIYQTRGTYTVRTYVRDDDGNSDSAQKSIVIGNDEPVLVSGLRDTTISINDSVLFTVTATDPEGIRDYAWDFDGDGTVDRTTASGSAGYRFPSTPRLMRPIVSIRDNADGVVRDTAVIDIILDAPQAVNGGKDSARVDSLFTLSTAGSSPGRFGRIVKYEWSLGAPGNFVEASGEDTVLQAPAKETTFVAALRITDDDGNTSTSTRTLTIYKKWESIGAPGFSAARVEYTSLAIASGTPYIAFSDWGNAKKATVMRFNGASWVNVGAPGFSAGVADFISLAVDAGTPYVAYRDVANGNKATVMKFDGANWAPLGTAGLTAGAVDYPSLLIIGGVPYLAFADRANGIKATVMRFDGANWVTVGGAPVSVGDAAYITLESASGTPYLAYTDTAHGIVKRFDGTNWVAVGAGNLFAFVNSMAFAMGDGIPYLTYTVSFEHPARQKTTVSKYDGSSWGTVGDGDFTSSGGKLTIAAGIPYFMGGLTMRFDGTNWIRIPATQFTSEGAYHISMASDPAKPYAAFSDGKNGLKATVIVYK
jgi:hypothetical protein